MLIVLVRFDRYFKVCFRMLHSAPTSPKIFRRGVNLGKYKLVKRLGDGASGQVWRARDTIERQDVALKIPHVGAEDDKLLREVQLNANLKHKHILPIRNADRIAGRLVIAADMAIESLDDRLQRRLAPRRAVNFLRQIIEGLAYAHSKRVIHRDVKPSNVLIFNNDRVRVSDFGIALILRTTMASATGSGTVLYAAPEQMSGYPCFASDVFSVGIMAYQMLTGRIPKYPFKWPFDENDQLQKKAAPELISIIKKATQFDHKKRYRDCGEMLKAFTAAEKKISNFYN